MPYLRRARCLLVKCSSINVTNDTETLEQEGKFRENLT